MSQNRTPPGIPTGGEFAANDHDEAPATLDIDVSDYTFREKDGVVDVWTGSGWRGADPNERESYENMIVATEKDAEKLAEYKRVNALAQYLEVEASDIEKMEGQEYHGLNFYEVNGEEWLVGIEEEADAAARSKAKDDAWATNPEFIARGTGIDEGAIRAIQTSMYENASEPIRKIIDATWDGGEDAFADELIEEDGRGHLLSGYDGEEQEQFVELGGDEDYHLMYRYN